VKQKKIAKALLAALCISLCFSGCTNIDSIIESDGPGNGEVFEKDLSEGLYVHTKDGSFYKPNNIHENFHGSTNQATNTRLTWAVGADKPIPTVYKDDALVYITDREIPEAFEAERFVSSGYTFGLALLSIGSNGKISIAPDSALEGSNAYDIFGSALSDRAVVTIDSIDGKALSKEDLSYGGCIKGLKKNETYTLSAYKGTHYAAVDVIADTRVFSSYEVDSTGGCTMTENGYAVVDISNLADGYYSFDGQGLIRICRDKSRK